MTEGIVISLEMNSNMEMGDRGSKSVIQLIFTIVKEQRVDGSSIIFIICKVYSSRRESRFLSFQAFVVTKKKG